MSDSNALGGYGTLFQRGDAATPTNFVTVSESVGLKGAGVDVSEEDSSHMQSTDGFMESIPVMAKRQDLVVEMHLVPNDSMQDTLQDDAETVPQVKRYWKITYPPASAPTGTLTVFGFVKKWDPAIPLKGKMTATLTLAISGKGTRT